MTSSLCNKINSSACDLQLTKLFLSKCKLFTIIDKWRFYFVSKLKTNFVYVFKRRKSKQNKPNKNKIYILQIY